MTEQDYRTEKLYYKISYWRNFWRPFMAWSYAFVCIFDFVLSPLIFFAVQLYFGVDAKELVNSHQPLTLQGGGLYHASMLAILGVSAYGRTQEKLEGVANNLEIQKMQVEEKSEEEPQKKGKVETTTIVIENVDPADEPKASPRPPIRRIVRRSPEKDK